MFLPIAAAEVFPLHSHMRLIQESGTSGVKIQNANISIKNSPDKLQCICERGKTDRHLKNLAVGVF